jgi:hypothetical protein
MVGPNEDGFGRLDDVRGRNNSGDNSCTKSAVVVTSKCLVGNSVEVHFDVSEQDDDEEEEKEEEKEEERKNKKKSATSFVRWSRKSGELLIL